MYLVDYFLWSQSRALTRFLCFHYTAISGFTIWKNEWKNSQSEPKQDLSPCSAPPVSFSLRVRDSISWHILPIIILSFRENCVRGNGSFIIEGKFCANMTKLWETLADEPNAFKTCTTSESFPSSAPKSWDRTAMPALSSLCGRC